MKSKVIAALALAAVPCFASAQSLEGAFESAAKALAASRRMLDADLCLRNQNLSAAVFSLEIVQPGGAAQVTKFSLKACVTRTRDEKDNDPITPEAVRTYVSEDAKLSLVVTTKEQENKSWAQVFSGGKLKVDFGQVSNMSLLEDYVEKAQEKATLSAKSFPRPVVDPCKEQVFLDSAVIHMSISAVGGKDPVDMVFRPEGKCEVYSSLEEDSPAGPTARRSYASKYHDYKLVLDTRLGEDKTYAQIHQTLTNGSFLIAAQVGEIELGPLKSHKAISTDVTIADYRYETGTIKGRATLSTQP